MDWASVLARRTRKEGWNGYDVHAGGFDRWPIRNSKLASHNADA
jgi:peptide/nickel transport system substrate-binding protein